MVRSGLPPPAMMETTFYDEHSYQPLGAPPVVTNLKRTMTLDLMNPTRPKKQPRFANNAPPLLSSPDLQMLKLATPDMDKWLMSQGVAATTPTPTSQQILFPAVPTEAQVDYAKGFVEALNELHHSDSSQGPFHIVDTQPTYTNLDQPPRLPYHHGNNLSVSIKDEPQTVPSVGSSTPPLSPIDMENQERIKLERKRQRNRLAASKCRRRKLERISRLEDKVRALKGENTELSTVVLKLKEHVCLLKEKVMEHVHSGCQIMNNAAAF